jgi:hypothetical protein
VAFGRDLSRDLGQVQRQHLGVGARQDEGGGGGAGRADGAEDVGPFVAPVARRAEPGSASRPEAGQRALLADSRFILEPDLDWFAASGLGEDGVDLLGEVFLNASWACGSLSGC